VAAAPDPLEEIPVESSSRVTRRVDTGGVLTSRQCQHWGGDFVGRDKIVHGDEVHGDKVGETRSLSVISPAALESLSVEMRELR